MNMKARNPGYVNTPASTIAKVKSAMADREYESVEELEKTVPELAGKTEGEIAQILQDAGMEVIITRTEQEAISSDPRSADKSGNIDGGEHVAVSPDLVDAEPPS